MSQPKTSPAAAEEVAQLGEPVSRQDATTNEEIATLIEQEFSFKVKRLPENFIIRVGFENSLLFFLWSLLFISNSIRRLGFWDSFTNLSTQYREAFTSTNVGRAARLDSPSLDKYSLWRGWVVPAFLAGSAYIITSLICLSHELYHWKPELLEYYFQLTKKSRIGRFIPQVLLNWFFQHYASKHREHTANRIQRRKHLALEDSKAFLKILQVVGFNLFISVVGVLVLWVCLLQTKVESHDISILPKSYVPPIQGLVWYFINDFFYFYPHWIAHTAPGTKPLYTRIFPQRIARGLHNHFKESHRMHHKTKANLGIAAWYCSPWEQIMFNLFPAFIGPLVTQVLADAAGVEKVWGTHLVTLYVWLTVAALASVLAHTGYRSTWNDPGKHDFHHERAFDPKNATNFGTLGFFDWLHGTASTVPLADTKEWRAQRDRQAALYEASRRTGIPLTKEQTEVIQQPDHSAEWTNKNV
ncbi:hypothetical protein H072_7755 [Dactylellina haptotyla CBS 200.50]|uniref:Fatty acid hydroxylase domain-containing protein n=1 Tax=Dactylellina haptotyla (strain CBS 200.50) TaxID=1284197 RepID=S8ABL0_DACHA|nr:hypothetical protein H072_7755 [Dactylellina haptotyla CBS 200.50]